MMAQPQHSVNTGRNLPVATAVGLLLLGTIIALLVYSPVLFAVLAAIMAGLGAKELLAFWPAATARLVPGLVILSSACVVLIGYFYGAESAGLGFVAATLALVALRLRGGIEHFASDVSLLVFTVFYTGLLLAFATDLANSTNALGRVMTLVLLTAANDTGGYFAGIFFGKTPLAPRISPKKSVEGLIGSIALATVFGALAIPHLVDITPMAGGILGACMALSATMGDLIESAIKRDVGVKDSGNSIPGHGGVLDRIDAQLVNAPIAWLALTVILGV